MARKILTAAVLIVCVAIIVTTLFVQNDRVAAQDSPAPDGLTPNTPTLANPFGNEVDWTTQTLENRSHERDYLKLAEEFSKIASHSDLEKMALELRLKIAEEKAARKMVEISKLLKDVVSEFPGTNGAKYAQHMLDGNECAGKTHAQPVEAEVLKQSSKTPVKEPPAPALAEPAQPDQAEPAPPKDSSTIPDLR